MRISNPVLAIWIVFSSVSLILGAGFSGGFKSIFYIPSNLSLLDLIIYLFTMAMFLIPFPIFIFRIIMLCKKWIN